MTEQRSTEPSVAAYFHSPFGGSGTGAGDDASHAPSATPATTATTATTVGAPSPAFVGASWAALLVGATGFLVGLLNATMDLSEKGYYLTLLLFGLFAAVALKKSVRDRAEGIPVTNLFVGICWFGVGSALSLLTIGLWNADLARSEKGFYAMAYVLCLFAAVTVQKNVRDLAATA